MHSGCKGKTKADGDTITPSLGKRGGDRVRGRHVEAGATSNRKGICQASHGIELSSHDPSYTARGASRKQGKTVSVFAAAWTEGRCLCPPLHPPKHRKKGSIELGRRAVAFQPKTVHWIRARAHTHRSPAAQTPEDPVKRNKRTENFLPHRRSGSHRLLAIV